MYIDQDGAPTEDVVVEVVQGADPAGVALASVSIVPGAVPLEPGFVSVDFSAAALGVTPGDFLAVRLSSLQDFTGKLDEYRAFGRFAGGYGGGEGGHIYEDAPPRTWDFFFRTFVDTDTRPVPEPGSLALLGLGLAGLGLSRRRKA